jgi:hypothetical protein
VADLRRYRPIANQAYYQQKGFETLSDRIGHIYWTSSGLGYPINELLFRLFYLEENKCKHLGLGILMEN